MAALPLSTTLLKKLLLDADEAVTALLNLVRDLENSREDAGLSEITNDEDCRFVLLTEEEIAALRHMRWDE